MHGSDEMMQLNREIHQTELDMEHALQEGDIEKARTLKETRENLQASREKLEKKNRRVSKNKVGGLALALCMYLKDHGKALPCGLIAMSPWTDLTASGESYDTNYERDPLFGNTRDSLIYNKDYVGDADETNPYISPLFGDFTGFPPMLIQVGSYEMLLSDSTSVAEKAKKQGVKVRLSIYEGMFHVFQMAMLMMPESKRAWAEVGKFIEMISE